MNKQIVLGFVVCACLLVTTGVAGQNKKTASGGEDQIKALLDQSRQAALKGDASYAENNMSDDYMRTDFNGQTRSKSDLVSALKNGDVKYESIDTNDVKVRLYGDAAVVTYGAQVKGSLRGQDTSGSYRVTRVFVKRGGKWQEVAFQSTRVS